MGEYRASGQVSDLREQESRAIIFKVLLHQRLNLFHDSVHHLNIVDIFLLGIRLRPKHSKARARQCVPLNAVHNHVP